MIDWTQLRVELDEAGNVKSGEIVFSHVDDVDGTLRHFAIERVCKDIESGKLAPEVIEFQLDAVWGSYAMVHRGVEQHRLARITAMDLCHYPVVFAHIPGVGRDLAQGQHMLIDGHHRYCKAIMLGWRTLRGYVLPPETWEQYLIYIPEEVLAEQSKKEALLNQHNVPIDSRIK